MKTKTEKQSERQEDLDQIMSKPDEDSRKVPAKQSLPQTPSRKKKVFGSNKTGREVKASSVQGKEQRRDAIMKKKSQNSQYKMTKENISKYLVG